MQNRGSMPKDKRCPDCEQLAQFSHTIKVTGDLFFIYICQNGHKSYTAIDNRYLLKSTKHRNTLVDAMVNSGGYKYKKDKR